MQLSLPPISRHYLDSRTTKLGLLVAAAAALQLAAGVGMAYVAGFSDTWRALRSFQWPWVIAVVGGLAISFLGYYYTYQGLYQVEEGPDLEGSQMRAVVTAGFGGFLAHGGAALDTYALEAAGADDRDAKVRVTALGGMEHGVLGLVGSAAAIAVLAQGKSSPPLDFSLPWAVIPVPGFLLAFWLAERYRDRFRDASGWRGRLGVFLDSIHLVRVLFRHPMHRAPALLGMTVFWVAECFMGWAGLAAFGFHMNVAQFVVGFGTGMVFTRRTGPLAGAGVLEVVLPVTVWYSGAPFAVAVVGMFFYRAVSLWLPMPLALGRLGALREMGEHRVPGAEGTASGSSEPGLSPPSG